MAAKITLSPTSAAPGATVTVKGTGFGWKWWCDVTLDGTKVARVLCSTSGTFTTTFVVLPGAGAKTVKAKVAYRSATATLTVTGSVPVDPPPVISGIVTTAITQTGFTVSWLVSEKAKGWVEYGLTTAYGTETPHETSLNFSAHSQTIAGLTAGTTYHFRAHAEDATGQHVTSADQVMLTSGVIVPPPTPGPRPWPAPVTTQTVTVPSNVSDSVGLNAWIKTVPNGSVVGFVANKVYQITKGLLLEGRSHLAIKGNGARFVVHGSGGDKTLSPFLIRGGSHDISIDDGFTVEIDNYTAWPQSSGEGMHILSLLGGNGLAESHHIEIADVTADYPFGDFAYLEGKNEAPHTPSHHIWIHRNKADHVGRQPISFINATDVLIERNEWPRSSYHVYDIEPNFAGQQVRRVTVRDEIVGSFAHRSGLLGFFISDRAVGSGVGSKVSDLLFERITVAGIAADGVTGRPRALQSACNSELAGGGVRQERITLRDISTTRAVSDNPVLWFKDIDGVTVQRITQPLAGGTLLGTPGCTGVVTT